MKKTINVNLAGQIFYVEEDAYPILDTYLQTVKAHFATFADSEEIQKDIESRIAEQLYPKTEGASPIVDRAAVEAVIAQMGNPSDFTETEDGLPKRPSAENETTKKTLYRSSEDAMLGGVAAGIATYFAVDTLWIRLIFFISIFLGGYGILIYLVLWIIVPEAKTPSEKVAMRGGSMTLKNLEQSIREKIKEHKEKGTGAAAEKHLESVLYKIGTVFVQILQVVSRIAGGSIAIASSIAIIALLIGTVALISGSYSAVIDFPLRDALGHMTIILSAVTLFALVSIPLLFLVLMGTSALLQRNHLATSSSVVLLLLWVVAIAVGTGIFMYNAPHIQTYIDTAQNRSTTVVEKPLEQFTKIVVENGLHVTLAQGQTRSATIVAAETEQQVTSVVAKEGVLTVSKNTLEKNSWCIFCLYPDTHITITTPDLTEVILEHGATLQGKDLSFPMLQITARNASAVSLTTNTPTITATAENASRITLIGNAETATYTASNGSKINAQTLLAKAVLATAKNGSRIDVTALESLKSIAENGSLVTYTDKPPVLTGPATPSTTEPIQQNTQEE